MFIIAPTILGISISRREDRLPLLWVKGYLTELALVFMPAFFCALAHTSLKTFLVIYVGMVAAAAAAVLVRRRRDLAVVIRREIADLFGFRSLFSGGLPASAAVCLAAALVAAQAVIPVFATHIDDDDATYVAMATTAVDTDTVLDYDPLTGADLTSMTKEEMKKTQLGRYIIAPLSVYYAALSKLTGIRPAVMCHTVMPFFLTLMAYILFAEIGRRLFKGRPLYTAAFIIMLSLIHMSSYYSVYTTGTFLIVRIWQGKGQVAGIAAPALILALLNILADGRARLRDLGFLEVTLIAATVMTAIGSLLGVLCVMIGAAAMFVMRSFQDIRSLLAVAATVIPPLTIMAYYALVLS